MSVTGMTRMRCTASSVTEASTHDDVAGFICIQTEHSALSDHQSSGELHLGGKRPFRPAGGFAISRTGQGNVEADGTTPAGTDRRHALSANPAKHGGFRPGVAAD